jgi:nitrogen regulatory protein PII
MKEIKAYIKEFKQEAVTRALHQIEGVTGASFSRVLGFGRGKDQSSGYNPDADPSGYVRHVKVEVVCDDAVVEKVVDVIHRAPTPVCAGMAAFSSAMSGGASGYRRLPNDPGNQQRGSHSHSRSSLEINL